MTTGTPISIILDNAAYQRSYQVEYLAVKMGIELVFLPPYSPNLNLIERMWKFIKSNCLYAKEYENFTNFHEGIESCLETAHLNHKNELDSLLSWNFQVFSNVAKAA